MPNKLFYNANSRIYISSYRKANIRALAEHCIGDFKELSLYIHKIAQLRFYVHKYILLHMLLSCRTKLYLSNISNNGLACLHYLVNYIFTGNNMFTVFQFYNLLYVTNLSNELYSAYGLFLGSYSFSAEVYKFFIFYKNGTGSLPTAISRFTVLRSPHTDKKSREQFERRTYRKVYMHPTILFDYYAFLCEHHYVFFLSTLAQDCTIYCHE